MRKIFVLMLLIKTFFVFSQTQQLNQLIDDTLPFFIINYYNTHNIDLVIINNQMPYRAVPSANIKTKKYIEGKTNGGLKDGYYCTSPSFYLVSKDTLCMQFFVCRANKKISTIGIGDTILFFFVYQEQTGGWVYANSISSHASWYRKGKFIGDFVKESMEGCFMELKKNNSISHDNVYVVDDYLTLFVIERPILTDLPHIPKGHYKNYYCKSDDWLIGFPEISFYNDTIAISSKALRKKDLKKNNVINNYIEYTLFYHYEMNTLSWNICKRTCVYRKKDD